MSGTEKLRVPTSNRSIMTIVLAVLLIMVMFFMLPLYLQNRLNRFTKCSTSFRKR